eukprot:CAMPEP_0172304904 /NCGR_PEP_ID=MMETSP1058-20130122/6265_1 /TAXON_ID=83371 /ORGANISM="Detonula confervacea, Strain CCMP 353" /LENGTH=1110 /DNA_ID=CAMNT_0013016311 /DNA_START=11 /DNA_END=3343 /DNA_ORIENTATION=+
MSYNYDECVQSTQDHRRRAYANASDATTTATAAIATSAPDLEALQQSMDGFATLSKHCPMTPLLWMQYSHDTEVLMEGLMMLESSSAEGGSEPQQRRLQQMQAKKIALESSTGILELALGEFPGCALLHLYYLESLADYVYQGEGLHQLNAQSGAVGMELDDRRATKNKLSNAFENAWQSVGKGTHVNEGVVVSEIYRLHGSFLLFCLSSVVAELKTVTSDGNGTKGNSETNAILQQLSTLFHNWSKTPMGEGSNDEMMQDIEYFWDEACPLLLSLCDGEQQKLAQKQDLEQQKASLWANIDDERKKTSTLMNVLSSYENEVDVAMSSEGIVLPRSTLFPQQQDESNDDDLGNHAQSLKRISAKWHQILLGDTNRFLLGLGGSETSRAFLKATSFLQRIYQGIVKRGNTVANADRSPLEDYVATYKCSIISSLYERAVSECPTSEPLWVSYMNFLRGEWTCLRNIIKGQKHMLQGQELNYQQQQKEELLSALQSASHRAVRNCPYSSTLFEIRMTTLGLISVSNLEPDDITAVVQEATEMGFLNHNQEAMLHLRLVAILVVKRRLLSLVSLGTTTAANGPGKDYDEGEEMGTLSVANQKKPSIGVMYQSLNPSVMEEVQDLLEDIRDMYEEADNFLFKSHPTWSEGKVALCKHRALTEAYVLCPIGLALRNAFDNDDEMAEDNEVVADKEAIKCFEKLVKAQKPSHPDSWREYIRYASTSHLYSMGNDSNSTQSQSQPDGIATAVSTLRKTRGLYNRAMSSVKKAGQDENWSPPIENTQSWMGKGIDSAMFHRDYDAALSDLCHEYLELERTAGSEGSFSQAQTLIRSKLANLNPLSAPAVAMASPVPNIQEEAHGKRKLETSNNNFQPENGSSMMTENHDEQDEEECDTQSKSKRVKVKTDLKQPKKTDGVHKVRVGKMDYPAHPYTIHVSKLNKETQDMDLVDAFRLEFGDIVHAKILRDKRTGFGGHHFHGESKCAGLIQFEERLSAENALQKSGEFEVGGKLVKIQRSHLPAVGLVPSGMHRVNPKGEGKVTKRNKFKKESKMKVDTNVSMDVVDNGKDKPNKGGNQKKKNNVASASPSSISLSVLSFKPRGMRQKPKISLDSMKK